jgi:hypothetical protein
MRRIRFTIGNLVSVVVCAAVATAALRMASDEWDSGLAGITLLALLTAVLMAVHRAERKRAFWLGFALFGWVYLIASLVPGLESRLPTTKGLAYLDTKVATREQVYTLKVALTNSNGSPNAVSAVAFSPSPPATATLQGQALRLWSLTSGTVWSAARGTSENFVRIGHSIMALLLAFVGGGLSRRLHDRNNARMEARAELPSDPTE